MKKRFEVGHTRLRSLEERECAKQVQEFETIFRDGRAGEPDAKTISRLVARQKARG